MAAEYQPSSFWKEIENVTRTVQASVRAQKVVNNIKIKQFQTTKNVHSVASVSPEEITRKIENQILKILSDLRNNQYPKFTLNKRGYTGNVTYTTGIGIEMLDDVTTHEISLENKSSLKKYTAIITCLSTCYELIQKNTYMTKRDLYYKHVNLFENQRIVDDCIADISCMLGVPRHNLHILSSSKGLIAGDLTFKDGESNLINCKDNGIQIPNHIVEASNFQSDAKYILVIEKEATFTRLVESKYTTKTGPCIILTGKGFPDINTRIILRKLIENLEIPAFALVDSDPYGIEIFCIYKYGSMSLSHEVNSLVSPTLKWLGILPSEMERLGIKADGLIDFTEKDKKKCVDLLKRKYINENERIGKEICYLDSFGKKAEIECLDTISLTFMTDIYLPSKLRNGEWV